MLKVFAVCGMGLGTSNILKSRLKEALNKQGVDHSVEVSDASAVAGQEADLIFTSEELGEKIRNKKAKVIIINNFTDRKEIGAKVETAVAEIGA